MKFHINLMLSVMIFLLIIGGGSYAYHYVEGWSGLDSIYFVVVTVTTIGYGDLYPQTDIGKVFTMFFSFFGIAVAFYFVSLIGGIVFKKHLSEKIHQLKESVERQTLTKKKISHSKKQ